MSNGDENGNNHVEVLGLHTTSAQTYYRKHGAFDYADGVSGRSVSVAGEQPSSVPDFIFGRQPEGMKDKYAKFKEGDELDEQGNTTGKKIQRPLRIGVIGGGGVYTTFMRAPLDQLGVERWIVDANPNLNNKGAKGFSFELNPLEHRVLGGQDRLPKDLDFVVVGTPPEHRLSPITTAQNEGYAVMVEKPVAATGEKAAHLDKWLKTDGTQPLFAIDWEVALAAPLMAAAGLPLPYADSVTFSNREAFKQFDFNNVVSIDARYTEGGNNPLLAQVLNRGGWLQDPERGGGTLFDMMVHPMNTLAVMGFLPDKEHIKISELGHPQRTHDGGVTGQGTYDKLGLEGGRPSKKAEWYAHMDMMMTDKNGRSIPTTLETAKFALENDQHIILTDKNGMKLKMELDLKERNKVTLLDKDGRALATAHSTIDPYVLMFDEATRFFAKEQKLKAEDPYRRPTALYMKEHLAVLHALDRVHEIARHSHVDKGEQVQQLKIREGRVAGQTVTGSTEGTHSIAVDANQQDGATNITSPGKAGVIASGAMAAANVAGEKPSGSADLGDAAVKPPTQERAVG